MTMEGGEPQKEGREEEGGGEEGGGEEGRGEEGGGEEGRGEEGRGEEGRGGEAGSQWWSLHGGRSRPDLSRQIKGSRPEGSGIKNERGSRHQRSRRALGARGIGRGDRGVLRGLGLPHTSRSTHQLLHLKRNSMSHEVLIVTAVVLIHNCLCNNEQNA